jgi:hypothetical protein
VNGQAEVPKEEVFAESELKRKVANAARKETEAKNQDEWEGEWTAEVMLINQMRSSLCF